MMGLGVKRRRGFAEPRREVTQDGAGLVDRWVALQQRHDGAWFWNLLRAIAVAVVILIACERAIRQLRLLA
jgi:hypothetical protein